MRILTAHRCLVVLLVALGGYRLSLIRSGHFYWGDERCYLPAAGLVDALREGDYRGAAEHLFVAGAGMPPARPGYVAISVLSDSLQRAVAVVTGKTADTPSYYDAASGFNVAVTLGVTVLMFAMGRCWTGSSWYGLLAASVYSLLGGANVWIRHLVAYPESLLLGLWALWLLSGPAPLPAGQAHHAPNCRRRAVLAGGLTALAYACYPGHYPFLVINGLVALVCLRPRVRCATFFGLSATFVIAVFEGLARLAGRSYLSDLRRLSGSVSMGDPKEGYVFAWRYLRDVEGAVGVVLSALFALFLVRVLWRRPWRGPSAARVAMVAAVACYLFHASMGVLFGKMVFYGRLVLAYVPFIVLGAVLALRHIRRTALRRLGIAALGGASAFSFATFALEYRRVVYPADFLQETMKRLGRGVIYPPNILWDLPQLSAGPALADVDPDLATVVDPRPEGSDVFVRLASHRAAGASGARFIGVNFKYLWYVAERYDRFVPPEDYVLVAEALHPVVFRASLYEGRRPWERTRIRKRRYTMRLYERQGFSKPTS